MKLPLKHPLTIGKITISALTFRDYTTAGDYLAFDKRGGVAQRIALVASLTGTDETLIAQLRGPDWLKAERMADDILMADESSPEESPEKKSQES